MKNAWSHHIHNNNEYHIKKKKKEPSHEKKMPGEWREQALQGVARQFVEMHETDRPIFMLDVVIVEKSWEFKHCCVRPFFISRISSIFPILTTWTNTNSTSNVHFWLDLEHTIHFYLATTQQSRMTLAFFCFDCALTRHSERSSASCGKHTERHSVI